VSPGADSDDRDGLRGYRGDGHGAIIGSQPPGGDELCPAPVPSVLWQVPG
jgi:hypothetical protein